MATKILDTSVETRTTAFQDAGIWVFRKALNAGSSTDEAMVFARDWMRVVKHMMHGIERTRRERVKH